MVSSQFSRRLAPRGRFTSGSHSSPSAIQSSLLSLAATSLTWSRFLFSTFFFGFSQAFCFLPEGYSGMFEGLRKDSMVGNGVRVELQVVLTTLAASLWAFILARISLGVGKSNYIMSSARSTIIASSSVNGSINSEVPKSLLNTFLITKCQST